MISKPIYATQYSPIFHYSVIDTYVIVMDSRCLLLLLLVRGGHLLLISGRCLLLLPSDVSSGHRLCRAVSCR